jgi:integrase/recombinase XerD
VKKILDEALNLNGGREGYASAPNTFRLLLELMLETGMRVSDAVRFDPSVLHKGESGLWIYGYVQRKRQRTKHPVQVEAYISNRFKKAMDGCKWLSPKKPFWYGETAGRGYKLGYQVYDLMQSIGARCGVDDCRPHRLRDTFAVRALLRGVSLEDVSRLLGHSSVKVTELYYAKWVAARKVRLERLVAQSLVDSQGHTLGD